MTKTLLLALALSQVIWAQAVPHQRFNLSKVSWSGTSHQEGGDTRIGGYLRNPNTEFDWETLLLPDLSNVEGNIDSMVVRIHAKNGQTGYGSSIQLFSVDQPWNSNTIKYDDFGTTQWSNLLENQSVGFYTNDKWYEFRGQALNQLAANWQNNSTANNGMILTGNFWYWGYYMVIDQAEVLIYTSSDTQNDEIAQFLSFENFDIDWTGQGQIDQAIIGTDPSHGQKNLSLAHYGNIVPNSGIKSRFVTLPAVAADIDYLLVDVKVQNSAALNIKLRNNTFSTMSVGVVAIPSNNGQYQTISFPLSQALRDFINQGDVQFEINVGDGQTFEIEVDNLRFSS